MKKRIISTSFLAFLLLIGCSNTEPSVNREVNENASSSTTEGAGFTEIDSSTIINADLTLTNDISPDNTMIIRGKTNLPSGMELMLDLKNNSSGYFAQEEVIVINGSFRSDSFSNDGYGLDKGSYSLLVTSSTANVQPYYVKKLIGENGSNLKGKIVTSDPTWGNTISTTKEMLNEFEIGLMKFINNPDQYKLACKMLVGNLANNTYEKLCLELKRLLEMMKNKSVQYLDIG